MLATRYLSRVIPSSTEVKKEDLDEISRLCVEHGTPSLAELLLAEGRHYIWKPERLAPDRAILMAAIACELAVKTALGELADPDDLVWVDLILDNPRDISVAAVNLWNKAMKAATGHSLSVENGALLQKRLETLISKRNGIVHRDDTRLLTRRGTWWARLYKHRLATHHRTSRSQLRT